MTFMKNETEVKSHNFFERIAASVTKFIGSTIAFIIALVLIISWAASGPYFDFSEHWVMFIHIVTTIITFLIVFLIQKAQNKDSMAIQLKLNELVAANALASNRLVNIENITDEEMKAIQKYYAQLSKFVKSEENSQQAHSIDGTIDISNADEN